MNNAFGFNIFAIIALICIVGYLLYIIYYAVDLFALSPRKKNKVLTKTEVDFISRYLPAYKLLSVVQKEKFKKRVSRFRANKKFIFYADSRKNEEIKILLSATATFLTLGFKDYRITSIDRILIYPSEYFSNITKQNHLGEYNPRLKTLVFSEEHITNGFNNPKDNLNLGVHEFAHALVFNFKNKYTNSATHFKKGLANMNELLVNQSFLKRMEDTTYFREYGTTNVHEFFAVALENYVETPTDFTKIFPELFDVITTMLNFEALKLNSKS